MAPGRGDALAPEVAAQLGRGLGVDPSPVRVHADLVAEAAAAELGVRAFTWGVDVFLANGERPTDVPLLAHEVTHAVQQAGGPAIHLFDGPHGELEYEAHRTAAVVASGGRAVVHGRTSGPKVQGQFDWARRGIAAAGSAISSAASAVADVSAELRDRAMAFIKDKAKKIPGYDLLGVILGRDPVTQQPVSRTAEGLIKGVLDLVPGGSAWFDNLQQAKVIERTHDWLTAEIAKLNITWAEIGGLFAQAWSALSASDLVDWGGAWEKLKAIFDPPLSRIRALAVAAGHKVLEFVFEGALALAGGAGQRVLAIFRRIGAVFGLIVADPLKFLGNLLSAVKGGFSQFWSNIGAHLRTGVFEWLTGALQGVVQLPSVWDFAGIFSLILQILGLTYSALRAVLVKIMGEQAVAYIEQAFEFVKLVATKGLSAAWEKIKEFAGGLVDQVINAIRGWIAKSVVGAAVTKLLTMFNPVGAVIQGVITIYNTVMFFIERAQQIARVVNSIIDSIENIAKGATAGAANFVEKTLAETLPVVIGFLARLVGLGSMTGYVRDIIGKIRTTIADALEKVGLWIKARVQSLLARSPDQKAATPTDKRTSSQIESDLNSAAADVDKMMEDPAVTVATVQAQLPRLKSKYTLTSAKLITDVEDQETATVHFEATVNPTRAGNRRKVQKVRWPANLGDLQWHEMKGGHLIERHIDVSNEYLRQRRLAGFRPGDAPMSRWASRSVAGSVITQVCLNNKTKIDNWIIKNDPTGSLRLYYSSSPPIGEGYRKGEAVITPITNAVIELSRDGTGGWFVLTGWPGEP